MSRVILARDAAARIGPANCAAAGQQWAQWEAEHSRADSRAAASEIVRKAAVMCQECPVMRACSRWAETEKYTGLAAASAYENGRARPDNWLSPGPKPTQKTR